MPTVKLAQRMSAAEDKLKKLFDRLDRPPLGSFSRKPRVEKQLGLGVDPDTVVVLKPPESGT